MRGEEPPQLAAMAAALSVRDSCVGIPLFCPALMHTVLACCACFSESLNKKYGKDLHAVETKKGKWKRFKRAAAMLRAM